PEYSDQLPDSAKHYAELSRRARQARLSRRNFLLALGMQAGLIGVASNLVGCSQATPATPAPATAKAAGGKDVAYDTSANIVYWGEAGERWEWPERGVMPMFNKIWPNIKTEVYAGPIGDMLPKIQIALASKTDKYDVISQDYYFVPMNIKGGQIEKIQPYLDRDPAWRDDLYKDVPEVVLDTYRDKPAKQGGELYGLPPDSNSQLFYYRKDVFEKAGIKAPPKTWDDTIGVAKQLTGGKQYGYIATLRRGQWAAGVFTCLYWSHGGIFFGSEDWANMKGDQWKVNIHDDAAAQALKVAQELIKYAAPGVLNAVDDEANGLMADGTGVMGPNLWGGSVLTQEKTSKFWNVMGTTVSPAGSGPKGKPAPTMGGLGLIMPVGSKNKEAAWAFMKFMVSPDVVKTPSGEEIQFGKAWVENFGQPSRNSLLQKYASVQSYFPALGDSLKVAHRYWPIAENGALMEAVGTHFASFLVGDIKDTQFMDNVERDCNDILKKAGYFS
ncbi:MAG: extracellular solute-binding protein, partial [Chloroflexota bacterium]